MLDVIAKLLILQDRDRKLRRVQGELARIEPERQAVLGKASAAQAALENAKLRVKQIESDRKGFELEIEGKKAQIVRYANQQLETRKNEEYRALSQEIETCKAAIFQIEDQEISLMEQAEAAQRQVDEGIQAAAATRKRMEEQVALLNTREQNLQKDYTALQAERETLAGAIDPGARARYERLRRSKGDNVLVGVHHGVCGGCHMRLPPQLLVTCQADKELVTCSNCGRLLYYTADMDLAIAE